MNKPKVRNKKRLFREVSFLKKNRVGRNYLKNLYSVRRETCKRSGVTQPQLNFMLWCYDKEFWTTLYAVDDYKMSKDHLEKTIIWPLTNSEYIFKYFNRLTPPKSGHDDHLFREENHFNYRVRYAITQKARLFVQRFYRDLEEGLED